MFFIMAVFGTGIVINYHISCSKSLRTKHPDCRHFHLNNLRKQLMINVAQGRDIHNNRPTLILNHLESFPLLWITGSVRI